MNTYKQPRFLKSVQILLFVLFCTGAMSTQAQFSITGPTSVNQNDTDTYNLTNTSNIFDHFYSVTGGSIVSQRYHSADVQWTHPTTGTLTATVEDNSFNIYVVNLTVSITSSSPPPATPATPTISSQNCGTSVTLQRGTPPSGVTWYWQGIISGGTSTANSSSTYTATNNGTYYLRARDNTTQIWSTASSSIVVSIPNTPTIPSMPTINASCNGSTVLTKGSSPSGITWYWQTSATGESTANSSTSVTLTSGSVYYLRAKDNTTNCWSTARTINYSINTTPAVPAMPTITQGCGSTTLTKGSAPSGVTWYWQTSSTGVSTANSSSSVSFTSAGTYYLRAKSNTADCWSSATTISYSVTYPTTWYLDSDGDGFGDASSPQVACSQPSGYVNNSGDACAGVHGGGSGNGCPITPSTGNENYIHTTVPRTATTDISTLNADDKKESRSYFDGIGRNIQNVAIRGGKKSYGNNEMTYDWSLGNTGSTVFYNKNGSDSENKIISGTTPFGDNDLLWECVNDAASGPDGGWSTNSFAVDRTKTYRYTVWVKKTVDLTDGHTYHGAGWSHVNNLNGTLNTNPYFWIGDLPQLNTWYLLVGIIHPHDYTGGETGVSGVYDIDGNKVMDGTEFKWTSTVTQSLFRNYLYYATNPATRQYFWSPLVQKMDGTEDSLIEVLSTSSVTNNEEVAANHIVTHVEYDEYGRQIKEYLPYASMNSADVLNPMADVTTQSYYQNKYANDFVGVSNVTDINAFSEKVIELSSLGRIHEQTAPGKAWKKGSANVTGKEYSDGNTIKFEYDVNGVNEVRYYSVTTNAVDSTYVPTLQGGTSYYDLGELTKTITKDENWKSTDGLDKTTEEFKNKQGQVLLKRTYNATIAHDTYYVYDDFGNLTYVIPPKVNTSDGISASELDELCYQYVYDYRNRLVEKKIPGKGEEYIVYDKLDRPILTQDAIQRAKTTKEWLFTKYDKLGRVVLTGLYKDNNSRASIQITANSYTTVSESYSTAPGGLFYYTKDAFPTNIPFYDVYTINYYDNYVYWNGDTNNPISNAYGTTLTTNTQGLATTSKVLVLEESSWITTNTGYDAKGRPIYVHSHNEYLGTTDIVESQLDDFSGRVLQTKTTHKKTGKSDIYTYDWFEYDHQDRMVSHTQSVEGRAPERIVRNNYDELGQLESKLTGNGTQKGYTDVTAGVTISGDVITKNGTIGWNHGLATIGTIQGDGYVEYIVVNDDKGGMVGLSDTNVNTHYTTLDYGIDTVFDKRVIVYEFGVLKYQEYNAYEAGDIFRVERIGTTIYYKKNGKVFYTSQTPSTGTLLGDVSMNSDGFQIKDLHIVDNSNGLQKVDYDYNVRGWLTNINDVDNIGSDLFTFKINYNSTQMSGSTPLFNGNIAETIWNTQNDELDHASIYSRGYSYQYDDLNRITSGTFKTENSSGQYYNLNTAEYYLGSILYDKNGNITRLNRTGGYSYNSIDYLTYTYDSGNKLLKVDDTGSASYKHEGFKDGTNTGDDYTYDANGNMITDANKGITDISYNHLNLPTFVELSNGNNDGNITYVYDASGVKLRKTVIDLDNQTTTTTDYAGNYIYENNNLQFFNHPEGYVKYESSNFDYIYQYKDHLGNVRISYADPAGTYQNILDDDFSTSFGNWVAKGNVSYSLENNRIKVNIDSQYEGIKNSVQDLEVTQGEIYTIKFKIDKANTQANLRVIVEEKDANNSHLRYVGLDWNLQTGSHTYTYTVGSGTKKITLSFEKDNTYISSTTQFYVDYVTFTKGNLEIIEESNYYPFGLKHKGYNYNTTANGNSIAQKWDFQRQEFNDDLGYNMHEYKWRHYDASIGRFNVIDPLAPDFPQWAPYVFSGNYVTISKELEGLEPDFMINGENGLSGDNRLTSPMVTLLNAAFGYSPESLEGTTWHRDSDPRAHWFAKKVVPDNAIAITWGSQVVFDRRLVGYDNNKYWFSLITHEQKHRSDIDTYGGGLFYTSYVLEGARVGGGHDDLGHEKVANRDEAYAGQLWDYNNGEVQRIFSMGHLTPNQMSQKMESVGARFRRDVILKDVIKGNKSSIKNIKAVLNGLGHGKEDRALRAALGSMINSAEQRIKNAKEEQDEITEKYGN